MTMPEDVDDAYALFQRKAAALDAALGETENEQADGRSGYAAYKRAEALAAELHEFSRVLAERIEEVRRTL